MSGETVEQQSGSKYVHVQAQPDHLESLARGKPINALAELIWNALDADADQVHIRITDNELGSPVEIEVLDNGNGITVQEAEQAFGNLGGSWKRDHRATTGTQKKLHGRNGKGRFKAFALGHDVTWDTTFLEGSDSLLQHAIKGQASKLQDFEIKEAHPAPIGRHRGTRVHISNLQESLGILTQDGSAARQFAEVFALYLRNYPATNITFRNERIDPKSVQKSHDSVELPAFQAIDGTEVQAKLDIVEWSFAKKERRICLCDSDGFALHEVEAGIRPGGGI